MGGASTTNQGRATKDSHLPLCSVCNARTLLSCTPCSITLVLRAQRGKVITHTKFSGIAEEEESVAVEIRHQTTARVDEAEWEIFAVGDDVLEEGVDYVVGVIDVDFF